MSQGQSMVIVAILLVVLIGMLALVLDGGYAYLQRRAAQTAADAGALAGAYELCQEGDANSAVARALDYAINRNEADTANVVVDAGVVTVDTTITFSTFFGRIFNRAAITAAAIAAAECSPASAATNILPVGYACPPEQAIPDGPITDCGIQYGEKYIILDTDSIQPEDCISQGGYVECDLDGDGEDEFNAARSWLYLGDGNINQWMNDGFQGTVYIHTWFESKSGNNTVGMLAFPDYINVPVALPIYNARIYGDPPIPWDDPKDQIVRHSEGSNIFYHVITFAKFVPTCVHLQKKDSCELFDILAANGDIPNVASYDSVEGYFEKGTWDEVVGGGTWYAGVYAITLIK